MTENETPDRIKRAYARTAFRTERQTGRAVRRHALVRAFKRKPRLRAGVAILLCVLVAFTLGLVIPQIPIGFETSRPETVQFLIAVASGVLPFIGIVYSLLFLVVQHASSSFSPRLNLFRDSPIIWYAFGYSLGVFVFALTTPFSIAGDGQVSGLVVVFLVLLLMGLLATLVVLQDAAFGYIELSSTLSKVGQRGEKALADFYPDEYSGDADDPEPGMVRRFNEDAEVRWDGEATVLQVIDAERVLRAAEASRGAVEFRVRTGESIYRHALLAVVEGPEKTHLAREIIQSLTMGVERTFEQDGTFVFRVLTDIALRALSSAINDPTTAVQALDISEALLRQIVMRDLHVGDVEDAHGVLRVRLLVPDWEEFLGIAVDEILALPGPPMLQVQRRLERLLDSLLVIAPPDRRAAITARRKKLESLAV